MPYMKLSNGQYYSVAVVTYLFNLAVVMILRNSYDGSQEDSSNNNPVRYLVSVTAAMFQPLIVYSLSGWLYYKASLQYEIQ
jgi:hypothetical protein